MRIALLLATLAACGDDASPIDPNVDAEVDASLDPQLPEPPMPPVPPALPAEAMPPAIDAWECPPGWAREETDPDSRCSPNPVGGVPDCAIDEAFFPGGTACERIGTACPTGDFADLPSGRTILYVRPGGTGDGSRASPFGTIAAALAVATPLSIVALAKGTFAETVVVPTSVTLWGACTAETVIAPAGTDRETATLRIEGSEAAVRNLRVTGDRPGIDVLAPAQIEHVVITDVHTSGIYVDNAGGVTAIRDVLVRNVRERDDGILGEGMELERSSATLERVVVEHVRFGAIYVWGDDARLKLRDVAVRDVLAEASSDEGGEAVYTENGAELDAERLSIERCQSSGVVVIGEGSTGDVRDLHLSEVGTRLDFPREGLIALEGGRLEAARVVIRDTAGGGVRTYDHGSLEIVDLLVDGAEVVTDSYVGGVLHVHDTAELIVRRALVTRSASGISAIGAGASLELEDVRIRDAFAPYGVGLLVTDGATASVARLDLARMRHAGIVTSDPGTAVVASDVVVTDTRPGDDADPGVGIFVETGAQLTGERVLLRENGFVAAIVKEESQLRLQDIVVEDTRRDDEGDGGDGLVALGGAQLTVERARLSRNADLGVAVFGPVTSAMLSDLTVTDTMLSGDTATALYAAEGARVDVLRAELARNARVAAIVRDEGTSVRMDDLLVDGVQVSSQGSTGIFCSTTADLALHRSILRGVASAGINVTDGATAMLEDVAIIVADDVGDEVGRGLNVQTDASVAGARIDIQRSREIGLALLGSVSASLSDLVVHDTLGRECASCANGPGGFGVEALDSASLDLGRFRIERSSLVALRIGEGVTLDLRAGVIAFNPVGVNVVDSQFMLGSIGDDVVFHDNATTLDAERLPVPSIVPGPAPSDAPTAL